VLGVWYVDSLVGALGLCCWYGVVGIGYLVFLGSMGYWILSVWALVVV